MLAPEPDLDYLDAEGTQYQLTIGVSDGYLGVTTGILTVNITWNNHAPVYLPSQYYVTIPEKCGDVFSVGRNPQWILNSLISLISFYYIWYSIYLIPAM